MRDANGDVLEFVYGGDCCDGAQLWRVDMGFLPPSPSAHGFTPRELELFVPLRMACLQAKRSLLSPRVTLSATLPFNAEAVLEMHRRAGERMDTQEEEDGVWSVTHGFLHDLEQSGPSSTLYLRATLLYHLRWTHLRRRFALTTVQACVERMRNLFRAAVVQPGECVGCLAAANVAEPGTQLTLSNAHFAGIWDMNAYQRRRTDFTEKTQSCSLPRTSHNLVCNLHQSNMLVGLQDSMVHRAIRAVRIDIFPAPCMSRCSMVVPCRNLGGTKHNPRTNEPGTRVPSLLPALGTNIAHTDRWTVGTLRMMCKNQEGTKIPRANAMAPQTTFRGMTDKGTAQERQAAL